MVFRLLLFLFLLTSVIVLIADSRGKTNGGDRVAGNDESQSLPSLSSLSSNRLVMSTFDLVVVADVVAKVPPP